MDNQELYNNSILLIGPSGAGKTTVSKELEDITGIKRLSIDNEVAKDRKKCIIDRFDDDIESYNLCKIKTLLEKARLINEARIVDFGGGHSVYRNLNIFIEIKKELSRFKNIVLLMPSIDIEKSIEILRKRSKGDYSQNREFIMSPCNRELATITIYENEKNPQDIALEILDIIKERKRNNEEILK